MQWFGNYPVRQLIIVYHVVLKDGCIPNYNGISVWATRQVLSKSFWTRKSSIDTRLLPKWCTERFICACYNCIKTNGDVGNMGDLPSSSMVFLAYPNIWYFDDAIGRECPDNSFEINQRFPLLMPIGVMCQNWLFVMLFLIKMCLFTFQMIVYCG